MPKPPVNDPADRGPEKGPDRGPDRGPDKAGAEALGPTVILPSPAAEPAMGPPAAEPAMESQAEDAAMAAKAQGAETAAIVSPSARPPTPGWFGKLPILGDFASRRLPEAFIKPWDDWLQASLAASRQAIGERWLDLYLTFPVWRFVVPAGLIADSCWIGVLLPSVDRVGRCFPLTICEPASRQTLEDVGLAGIEQHLSSMAEVGVEALDISSIALLEQRLEALSSLQAGSPRPVIALEAWLAARGPGKAGTAWPLSDPLPTALSAAAGRFVIAALAGRVLWWSPAGIDGDGGALLLQSFPFSADLLDNLIGTG